jgi:cell division protein FtsZ
MTKRRKAVKQPKKEAATHALNYMAKIKVVGIGGGGGNAISRMSEDFGVRGLEFVAINTDAQDLDYCNARKKIYIGKNLTRGLGTGMNPDIGKQAAEENRSEIAEALSGADLVFLTIGLGGGTGPGAGPVVAEVARESGALTVAVVTKPFAFEGSQRARIAQEALLKLKEKVDTLIVVPNDRIFSIIRKDTPLVKAFEYIDDVLRSAVQGIAELIALPGIVNVDFADVRAIMKDAGQALVGVGVASGQDRAVAAANQVVNSPLLEISVEGARGILFGIASNRDLKMTEINDVAKVISGAVDPAAKIIFGAYHDRKLRPGQLRVTLVATGFNGQMVRSHESPPPSLFSESVKPSVREALGKPMPEERKPGKLGEKVEEEKKSDDDAWEIPAFLRKKR